MKIYNTQITFREFPNEVSFLLNVSNCPCHCKGCHSTYLAQDLGRVLDDEYLEEIFKKAKGCTCIGIMGGDANPQEVIEIAQKIKERGWKVGWYSGRDVLPECWDPQTSPKYFDYVKIGHYDEQCGPLNSPTTNQRFFVVDQSDYRFIDRTKEIFQ